MADWYDEACAIAQDANEENFSSHRGLGRFATPEDREDAAEYAAALYLYDNHPYSDLKKGVSEKRTKELDEVKRLVAARGLRVLGEAEYPDFGFDDEEDGKLGYTVAIIFDASGVEGGIDAAERILRDAWSSVLKIGAEKIGIRSDPRITSKGGDA